LGLTRKTTADWHAVKMATPLVKAPGKRDRPVGSVIATSKVMPLEAPRLAKKRAPASLLYEPKR
jgi:hypothetical protein